MSVVAKTAAPAASPSVPPPPTRRAAAPILVDQGVVVVSGSRNHHNNSLINATAALREAAIGAAGAGLTGSARGHGVPGGGGRKRSRDHARKASSGPFSRRNPMIVGSFP